MASTFQITDGSTTVDFLADNDFNLLSWQPAVPSRRTGGLGGRGPYNDAIEEMTIGIGGTSASDTLGNLQTLRVLLDQAERWYKGEAVDPVLFKYKTSASGSTLSSVILGPPSLGDSMVELPENFTLTPVIAYIDNIGVTFRRSGLWLQSNESKTESDSTSNNPGLMTVTFDSSVSIPSPVKFELSLGALPDSVDAVVLVAQSTSHLAVEEAEDAGAGGNFSVVTASTASSGEIYRFTPNDTNAALASLSVSIDSDVRRVAIVASLKNRSSSISYTLRGFVGSSELAYTKTTVVDTSNNDPQVVIIGTVVSPQAIDTFGIEVTASATGSSANSLDIDTISIVALDDDVGRVFTLSGVDLELTVDHATLSNPSPQVINSNSVNVPYRGDIYLNQIGSTFAAAVIGNTGTDWRIRTDLTALVSIGMTVTRNIGRLTPY